MSLHNLETTITPTEHYALDQVVTLMEQEIEAKRDLAMANREEMRPVDAGIAQLSKTARRWLDAQSEMLFKEWEKLPAGSHLKRSYNDLVWTWSDRDLDAMPETNPDDLEELDRPGE